MAAFPPTSKSVFKVYEPQYAAVVLGAGCRAERDVILANTRADEVPVLRRKGGGGSVVLTPGQVVLALVADVGEPFNNLEYARTINGWIKESLLALGVEGIEDRGISDLVINGRKILGTSIYRRRLIMFYQASLLVNNDLSLFSRYLHFPARVPDYRKNRSHEEFCTTLHREGFPLSISGVIRGLEGVVRRNLPCLA